MKKKKILIGVVCVLILLIILACFWWHFDLKPFLLVQVTRHRNMPRIWNGIVEFENKFDRLPKNLEEIVNEGYLPLESDIYSCPMLIYSLVPTSIPYEQCEFKFLFEPNEIMILIPEEAFLHKELERYNNTAVKEIKIKQ